MKKVGVFLILVATVIGLTACSFNKIEETKKEEISSDGISQLNIDAGSGELVVKGDKDAKTIKVIASIKRSENVDKDAFIVNLQSKGDTANLEVKLKPVWFSISYRSMDVYVIVPEDLNVNVTDGSGFAEVGNISGDVVIDDGSGDLKLENLIGEVKITDGSGDMSITDLNNLKSIDDGSGSINIKNSGGMLKVIDGSGDLEVSQYKGDITIDDGSGDMDISEVNGSVEVKDGSGDITINGVEQNVNIIDDGSGDLHINQVKGSVTQ